MNQPYRIRLLAAAALAFCASHAHAVSLSREGIGQALVYPYYTTQPGKQTVMSVVNTTTAVKAVRVTFREGRNAREVLSFNLYLSPYDVWTAAVFPDPQGEGAALVTNDTSCTAPALRTSTTLPTFGSLRYAPFRNYSYSGTWDDGGGGSVARTREGFFELIEMGELKRGTAPGFLAEEATHTFVGPHDPTQYSSVPANCPAIAEAWRGGIWEASGADAYTDAPTGGLYGGAAIVDVAEGTIFSYEAEALDAFFAPGNGNEDLHTQPGSPAPSLASARTGAAGAPVRSLVVTPGVSADAVTSTWARGIDAVSAVFMADAVYNEYTLNVNIGAETEWVLTFPTKPWYTDDTEFGGPVALGATVNLGHRLALPPFAGYGYTRSQVQPRVGGLACESFEPYLYDREEITTARPPDDFPEPPPRPVFDLCGAANVLVLSLTKPSVLLGASESERVDSIFSDGWLDLRFEKNNDTDRTPGFTSLEGHHYAGLPVVGFAAVNIANADAVPGKLANYSDTRRHRTRSSIETAAPAQD